MNPSFAIIGCGRIAQRHAEQIVKHGQLVAVCDIIPGKADELATLYKAKPYYSIEELLKNEKDEKYDNNNTGCRHLRVD